MIYILALWEVRAPEYLSYILTLATFCKLGSFYALSSSSGSVKWLTQLGTSDIYSAPALSQDSSVVYIGNMDGVVYGLSASSGEVLMQYQLTYSVIGIAISNVGAVIVTDARYVYSLSSTNLSQVWYTTYTAVGKDSFHTYPIIDLEGNIYVSTMQNYVYSISSTGLIKWTYLAAKSRSEFHFNCYLYFLNIIFLFR